MNSLLESYLISRGLYDPKQDTKKEILENEALLSAIAGAWNNDKEAIQTVVRARLDVIRDTLLLEAVPQEVMVLRQALLEVAAILTDFESYYEEYQRRQAPPSPPPDDAPQEVVAEEPALGGNDSFEQREEATAVL